MGSSSMMLATATQTINNDRRAVLDHAVAIGDNSASTVNMTSYTEQADAAVLQTMAETMPDSIRAIAQMGATVVKDTGGAVVDLIRDSAEQNRMAWDDTLQAGAGMVDKLIDGLAAGFGSVDKAINAFQPTENKNADIGKYAMVAVAVVAAVVLLWGVKKS